eukprot:TRINITY_DN6629_c0_g1_i7.p1 TRINITY_DN6629_c0_g1~~TRINITY_DN6629_c0_g1_i7.p1  ORF type:complete len:129 (-),score=20.78 TRINITY_DN6629_c0_g1_i7:320-706(-)
MNQQLLPLKPTNQQAYSKQVLQQSNNTIKEESFQGSAEKTHNRIKIRSSNPSKARFVLQSQTTGIQNKSEENKIKLGNDNSIQKIDVQEQIGTNQESVEKENVQSDLISVKKTATETSSHQHNQFEQD